MPDKPKELPPATEGIIFPSGGDHVTIVAGVENDDVKVAVEAEKELGKDWSTGGRFQWAKDKGYSALGYLKWRPKRKR